MNVSGFLIPIRDYTTRTLAAVQYAIELHKRTGRRQMFLFIEDASSSKRNEDGAEGSSADNMKRIIEEVVEREVQGNGGFMEAQRRSGDFFEVLCDAAQHKHIDEIIVSVPAEDDPAYAKITQEISMLIQMTGCRVLTINPKKGS
jgi:hypothetical protein